MTLGSIPTGTPLEKRAAAIQKLLDIGVILQPGEWSGLNPPAVQMDGLAIAVTKGQGIAGWLTRMLDDLQDGDLTGDSMLGFPNAHGGIFGITITGAENGVLSEFTGETLQSAARVLGQEGATYQYAVLQAPSGFEFAVDGKIAYAIPADATPAQTIPVIIRVSNQSTGKGRTLTAQIYPMQKNLAAQATVSPGSGDQEIETPEHDTRITVSTDQISTPATVQIVKGVNAQGEPETKYLFDKNFKGKFSIDLPDPNVESLNARTALSKANAAIGTEAVARAVQQGYVYPLNNQWLKGKANFLKTNCGLGIGNRVNQKINALWDPFSGCTTSIGEGITDFKSSNPREAYELNSECALNSIDCYRDKTPVLFVHGFIPSSDVVSDDGLGGGEGTWGYFPQAMKNADPDIRVFEFRWATAARFQDVAADLQAAIEQIAQKTGKKVHIVAHSFGGILTRTYLQSLATGKPFIDNVASVTTVGSPHSGLFDTAKTAHNIAFPQGQDSQPCRSG